MMSFIEKGNRILEFIDLFGAPFHFYYGNNYKHTTKFGGAYTLLLVISIFVYTVL